jgi:hypothetical protein
MRSQISTGGGDRRKIRYGRILIMAVAKLRVPGEFF